MRHSVGWRLPLLGLTYRDQVEKTMVFQAERERERESSTEGRRGRSARVTRVSECLVRSGHNIFLKFVVQSI
jgi:hypothetical protein